MTYLRLVEADPDSAGIYTLSMAIDNLFVTMNIGYIMFGSLQLKYFFDNVRNNTSEPDKLKARANPLLNRRRAKKRSLKEMKDYIFGKDATLLQMMFPFF